MAAMGMDLTLVALAAGVGSRYGGLKQLEPVGPSGGTILEYSAYDALRTGFSRVVLVVRPETEPVFRESFENGLAQHLPLAYVHQAIHDLPSGLVPPAGRTKPWGTGQAILAAAAEIDGAFAVVNADDFYGAESFSTVSRFLSEGRERNSPTFAMVGFGVGQTLTEAGPVSRALCELSDDGHLQKIIEIAKMWKRNGGGVYTDAEGREVVVAGDELTSMNMWAFTPDLFPELRRHFQEFLVRSGHVSDSEFLVPDVIQSLIHEGRVQVEVLRRAGQWCGITFREDKQRVASIISTLVERGEYPRELWA